MFIANGKFRLGSVAVRARKSPQLETVAALVVIPSDVAYIDEMSARKREINSAKASFIATDFAPLVCKCETAYDVFRLLRSISKAFGYSHFQLFDMPLISPVSLSALSVVSNWPPELVNAYDANRLLDDSSVIETLMQSTGPLVWQVKKINENRTEERRTVAISLFREFGLSNGVYFSVHTAKGVRGAVSFAGERSDPSTRELMELSFLSSLIYERLKSFSQAKSAVEKSLSPREMQCLQWTAAGKTSLEIASILEISEHTVNHYLSTVCQKLDAHNRAHMVSKAMRMGLLQ